MTDGINRSGPERHSKALPGHLARMLDPMPIPDTLSATEAWLRLTLTLGPTAQAHALLNDFGSASAVFAAQPGHVRARVRMPLADKLIAPPTLEIAHQIDRALKWLVQADHHFITLNDPRYPAALRVCPGAPLALYVAGQPETLQPPGLAIVGTRRPTISGAQDAHDYAKRLAERGLPVISGLAIGIDAAAHEGALSAGPTGSGTIPVMGTGLLHCYPARHSDLARRIQAQGALVSEFPLDAGARQSHFPRRNRIVATLARGVLVVEASIRSSSLITARLAADAGRDVFAMPGSIHSPVAQGCNALIRDGAKLVSCLGDITDEYPNLLTTAATFSPQHAEQDEKPLDAAMQMVWDALGCTSVTMDAIVKHTGMTIADVAYQLTLLEIADRAARTPDGRYVRHSPAR